MCRTRSERFKKEGILSVVLYSDLGLCIEFGDDKIDDGIYGCAPTRDFIEALKREVEFHVENMADGLEHPTLRRVYTCIQGEENEEAKV